jgi:hypothetical protein
MSLINTKPKSILGKLVRLHKDLQAYESIDSNSGEIGGLHRDLQAHKCIEFNGWEIGRVT